MNVLFKIEVTIPQCAKYAGGGFGFFASKAVAALGPLLVYLTLSGHYLRCVQVQ